MTKEQVNVNEPAVTPQDSTQVQVDNKEEANDAIPTVKEVLANKRQEIASMVSEEDQISHVVPFSKVIAEGSALGNTVFIYGQWVVDGEVTILAGDTNACKSTVAYNVGVAISKGDEFLGVPTLESEVLYVETEMSSRQLYNRFKNVKVNENFKFLNAVGKTLDWVLDNVETYCKERKGNRKLVVMIDTLSWGIDFVRVKVIENGTEFHVQGFKITGNVKIQYVEGSDLFKVTIIPDNKQEQPIIIEDVYIDQLVSVIDENVEHCENYEKRISEEYGFAENLVAV